MINWIPIPIVISYRKSILMHRCSRTVDRSVLVISITSANTKPHTSNLTFELFHICSLTNKGPLLFDLLNDCKFDLFCLTETWQQPNDFHTLIKQFLLDLSTHHNPVPLAEGVTLVIFYNQIWKVPFIILPVYPSFESIALQIKGPAPTILATIYQPPKPNKSFLQEFSAFIHWDSTNNVFTKDFTSCLDSFGLQQHIEFPTHSKDKFLT